MWVPLLPYSCALVAMICIIGDLAMTPLYGLQYLVEMFTCGRCCGGWMFLLSMCCVMKVFENGFHLLFVLVVLVVFFEYYKVVFGDVWFLVRTYFVFWEPFLVRSIVE